MKSFRASRPPGAPRPVAVAAVTLVVCLVSAAAAYARGYMTPGFLARKSRPMRVAVLPPHAEFIKEKAIMTDQMVQESAALENEAAQALKTQLEAKGYKVRILTPQEISRTAGLNPLVKKLNDRYEEEWSKMMYKPKKVRESRYTTGDDALRLCALLKVDGVAIVRVQAVAASKGKAVLRYFANSSAPHTYARVDLGVIDARQGIIQGYFSGYENTSLGQLVKKPALVMGQATEHALKKYPESAEVRVVEEAVASADDKENGEGDPVGDFEVLLNKKNQKSGH
ncbi:MAG TPA: hypothetical protein VFT43_15155 [Candidatus Polarisedimenticolia bacterium]|nr:hypothetical protein [Candidatus Polarisedimenticolia bacterium]